MEFIPSICIAGGINRKPRKRVNELEHFCWEFSTAIFFSYRSMHPGFECINAEHKKRYL